MLFKLLQKNQHVDKIDEILNKFQQIEEILRHWTGLSILLLNNFRSEFFLQRMLAKVFI